MSVITTFSDAWVNGTTSPDRRNTNYGDATYVQVKTGERIAYLRPSLPPILGRTVLAASLSGVAFTPFPAGTVSVQLIGERWQPGRVTWTGRPGVVGPVATAVLSAKSDGDVVTVTGLAPLLQLVADGTPFYGLRVTTSAATEQVFYAADSGKPAWSLDYTLSELTDAPTNLRPDGGAVGTARPVLAWDSPGQVAFQVQIDTPATGVAPDEVTPDFDTGTISSTDEEFDVAASSHTPALTGDGPHWRVRVIAEGDDVWSDWSPWASYSVSVLPSWVLDSPVGAFGDPTPDVIAHLSTGTLDHWKATITSEDRADVRWRSELQTGACAFTVPQKSGGRRVLDGTSTAWLNLQGWDTIDRAVGVGQPDFVSTWFPLDFADDLGVQAPTDLRVSQFGPGDPRLVWRWRRTEAADAWVFGYGDRQVARVDAADVSVSAGFYEWTDRGQVPGMRPRDLWVRAVEGVDRSEPAMDYDHSHDVIGFWVLPEDSEATIVLDGTAVGGFGHAGRRAVYDMLVGPSKAIIYDANPGMTGAFEGSVSTAYGRSEAEVWQALDDLDALRSSRTGLAQLVWGSQSIAARVEDPTWMPSDELLATNLLHVVRFGLVQVD